MVSAPTTAVAPRVLHCPTCRRYLGKTEARQGWVLVYCPECRAWRRILPAM